MGVRNNIARQPDAPIELYDLERDPAETTDVSDANPDVVTRIAEAMRSSHAPAALPKWNFNGSAVR